ncbi:hypothetical protein [Rufibacter sp. LB8]|uniref:hypothetical protein n=1 Tax=Rufibacter sp. LB8 TaxID=2777781 RepID=UPI00178C6B51|nr:hypothetical protein [Rufibacter sp. LB8]
MENQQTKALADLIQNPSEISAIISNPAESGMEFYQALPNKDKSYVAIAAGLGLLAYGFYLGRSGKKSSGASAAAGSTSGADRSTGTSGASDSGSGAGASNSGSNNDAQGSTGKKKNK